MNSGGGLYKPWRTQKIRMPKNGIPGTCHFADLSKPLPDPPKGQTWVQDGSSREWKLLPVATVTADTLAVAHPAKAGDGANDDIAMCTAVAVAVGSAAPVRPADGTAADGVRCHAVLPTDTFQGICLRYKVTPTELRRANHLLGSSNLKLAPPELIIPFNDRNQGQLKSSPTREEQIASLLFQVSGMTKDKLSYSEGKAYLEIADWDVKEAVENVREDFKWSYEHA